MKNFKLNLIMLTTSLALLLGACKTDDVTEPIKSRDFSELILTTPYRTYYVEPEFAIPVLANLEQDKIFKENFERGIRETLDEMGLEYNPSSFDLHVIYLPLVRSQKSVGSSLELIVELSGYDTVARSKIFQVEEYFESWTYPGAEEYKGIADQLMGQLDAVKLFRKSGIGVVLEEGSAGQVNLQGSDTIDKGNTMMMAVAVSDLQHVMDEWNSPTVGDSPFLEAVSRFKFGDSIIPVVIYDVDGDDTRGPVDITIDANLLNREGKLLQTFPTIRHQLDDHPNGIGIVPPEAAYRFEQGDDEPGIYILKIDAQDNITQEKYSLKLIVELEDERIEPVDGADGTR
jgi:hypothetical protein